MSESSIQDKYKTIYSMNQNSTSEMLIQNGGNIFSKSNNNKINIKRLSNSNSYRNIFPPILYDSKINNLEIKISNLEKLFYNLENKIKGNEKNLLSNNNNNITLNELEEKILKLENLLSKEDYMKNNRNEQEKEIYKNILNKFTNKISEAVKIEISARFEGDIKNKINIENYNKNYKNEIENLKINFEEMLNEIRKNISNISNECSERTHNVSNYIDMKIKEILNNNEFINLKNFVNQLLLQIKSNLITQKDQNSVFESRLLNLEKFIMTIKNDVYNFIAKIEERLINKMKDIKIYFDVNIKNENKNIKRNLIIFNKLFEKKFFFLSDQISQTRILINEEFNRVNKREIERFESLINDMENICHRIYQYEDILKKYDKSNNDLKNQIKQNFIDLNSKLNISFVNKNILNNINKEKKNENNKFYNDDKKVNQKINELENNIKNINNIINKIGSIYENENIIKEIQNN